MYRSPLYKQNGFKNSILFDEWYKYTDNMAIIRYDAIITVELNFLVEHKYDAKLEWFDVYWIHADWLNMSIVQLTIDATH